MKRNNGSERWSDSISDEKLKIILDTTSMSVEGQVAVVVRAVREILQH